MSAPGPITVVAHWHPVANAFDEVLAIVAELRARSLSEPGCLGYEVYRSEQDPQVLLLLERYRDEAAIEAHRQSEHYQSLVPGRALPLLAERRVELLQARAPA
ncbi:MAG TPA: putative quinol monooxygenase [Pseudoduganella sp.]